MNLKVIQILLTAICFALTEGLTVDDAITRFFDYFKEDEPQGIPVIAFDEPMDLLSPMETIPVTMINGTLLGHSNLSFVNVMVDLLQLKAEMKLYDPRLEVAAIYSWPGFFSTSVGRMNATLLETEIRFNVSMIINENDTLQISDANVKINNEDLFLNMSNLLWEHELIMATGSVKFFFDDIVQESFRQMKPILLYEANTQLEKFIANMPRVEKPDREENSKPSIKYFLQRLMNYMGLRTLSLPNQQSKILGVNFKVTKLFLHGLSVVDDIKSMFFVYHDKEFYFEYEVVYPKLLLFYKLALSSGSFLNLNLDEKNQLNNVKLRVKLVIDPSQKNPPQIKDLHVHVESFGKLRASRNISIFQLFKNLLLDVADDIRNHIIGALTGPIKRNIQKSLNKMDLEKVALHLAHRKR